MAKKLYGNLVAIKFLLGNRVLPFIRLCYEVIIPISFISEKLLSEKVLIK